MQPLSTPIIWFGRLSTSIKIFSIITLALLPLGLIALFASLDTLHSANAARSAALRIALINSTRKLHNELTADLTAMSRAAEIIATDVSTEDLCPRLNATIASATRRASQYAIFGQADRPLCATPGFNPARPSTLGLDAQPRGVILRDALVIQMAAARGNAVVVVRYPAATVADLARPAAMTLAYAAALSNETASVPLTPGADFLSMGSETIDAPVGLMNLTLAMSAEQSPFGGTEAMLTFLPLLMWASAALIGFFVVDRLLIRPLRALQTAVAAHVPGTPFRVPSIRTPAREIRDLGATFARFGVQIAEHEAHLATALADQTRATREVHHRVKNNLQVIASLISLHARATHAPDAVTAYAAIQRRVDALSVVHRNHYADLDAGGIDIKRLLDELATNLRVSAADAPAISISAPRIDVGQDNAVAIAFLITELVELSMTSDTAAPIVIIVERDPNPNPDAITAKLSVASSALATAPAGRYARVIEGLARQLRAPLQHDAGAGRFAISFAIVDRGGTA